MNRRFKANRFAEFASYLGFHHRRITPFWLQANAECERFTRTLDKVLHAAVAEVRMEAGAVPRHTQL